MKKRDLIIYGAGFALPPLVFLALSLAGILDEITWLGVAWMAALASIGIAAVVCGVTKRTEGSLPEVTVKKLLAMQVCVPSDWSDEQVRAFAEGKNPCGTKCGWQIRREGSESLAGAPERQPCADRTGFVHVMLDA